ncbi:unnamed protein product [Rotaria sp. Silwood1]|nr:unnamed protein product [Rotaria sp. Silwood1]CAF0742752.1 unnamed protein product [Rotaria sp. Silwood1]CAF3334184.1 unnamed protein product [Rotaria sp. Silwood1]CAF4517505.1 unnamed protein product [Rotaria sp. Silwood1]
MGCRHSSSPPESPVKLVQNGGPVILKSKISVHRTQIIDHRTPNGTKTSRLSICSKKISRSLSPLTLPFTASSLEQTLNGHGKHLIKRFELDTPCLLLDVSRTHILLVDDRKLRLINMETMNMETNILPIDYKDIQEIAWSSKLNTFLLLTTDQLYQTGCKHLHPTPIHQIQFIAEGPRKSYMAVDGDDLLINRSFGYDIRRYSLTNFSLVQSPRAYIESENICVTTIRLNSNKILALAISIGKQQMIDLVNLNTDQLIHRINSNTGENILYPIDLHNNGQWFAKTCIPCVNIGHCLISSNGQIIRLKLFPNQDNFIRSICTSPDNRWLLVGRQHALELYQPCIS